MSHRSENDRKLLNSKQFIAQVAPALLAGLLGLQVLELHDLSAAGGAEGDTGSHVRFLEGVEDRLRLI
ncbi:hypothetical protein ACIPZG_07505 [Pseudomonas sp. NPDC089395]|uniref:hypothetical protein n=1 Tax=Pseudomonas sp. NPDC089395 TaxID=3364460 RepID=UPI00380A7830